ncbi:MULTISPECIES: phosphoribosylamine--glycine ligase [Thermus]|uniref:Phosphoribosylamine--glycine ligase n=1 Tax=Thermus scotoductus (strain ATCC 700910 / SA-01) TaxID=743525 RepID=E8PN09_THESS|nr:MULTISPECIES: phosphoribosylamine--glycine ligase [Thermus]ADW21360.1 phosphoribosylamine--glycine ligase [Thermus scotoductus SA-01]
MKVLVVGSGGREHALLWKAAQSPLVDRLYAAPGNAGMAALAELVPWNGDVEALADWALAEGIDLTLVGPEAPLVEGIADAFQKRGLLIFGPTQKAAMIEGSKAFAKRLMERYGIPTARYRVFQDALLALEYVESVGVPIVIKDSGLAAGKGVTVAFDLHTAKQAILNLLSGPEGGEVVVEEYLEGDEATVLALTDGETVLPLLPSQDHKRLLDGDQGPMTGGMGAVAPYPMEAATLKRVEEEILKPLIQGLRAEGVVYRGVVYAGLMLTREGPKVLEFNARFGDPEAQALLPLLQNDLVDLALRVAEGRLGGTELAWREGASACVVLAAPGYPESPRKGIPLHVPEPPEGVLVFHAGTRWEGNSLVSAGGRVLNVVGLGKTLEEALSRAYGFIPQVGFPGAQYRKDIGHKALRLG